MPVRAGRVPGDRPASADRCGPRGGEGEPAGLRAARAARTTISGSSAKMQQNLLDWIRSGLLALPSLSRPPPSSAAADGQGTRTATRTAPATPAPAPLHATGTLPRQAGGQPPATPLVRVLAIYLAQMPDKGLRVCLAGRAGYRGTCSPTARRMRPGRPGPSAWTISRNKHWLPACRPAACPWGWPWGCGPRAAPGGGRRGAARRISASSLGARGPARPPLGAAAPPTGAAAWLLPVAGLPAPPDCSGYKILIYDRKL